MRGVLEMRVVSVVVVHLHVASRCGKLRVVGHEHEVELLGKMGQEHRGFGREVRVLQILGNAGLGRESRVVLDHSKGRNMASGQNRVAIGHSDSVLGLEVLLGQALTQGFLHLFGKLLNIIQTHES